MRLLVTLLFVCLCAGCAAPGPANRADTVTISVVGTNDVHGQLSPHGDRGGLETFSGYVAALREARKTNGAVLVVDAGDMWQGTLASNLTEGSLVVEAYNALGYAVAAVGNHEFDFGPAGPKSVPVATGDDPRGALRQRASEAAFPLLAANIVEAGTGQIVTWTNVRPATMLGLAGVNIGLVGVVTENALATTIAANTVGLRIAPLEEAVVREARALRAAGADLVIVLAHAGGRCERFDDPHDLSSCHLNAEIMRMANAIPEGLVDHVVAGHVHEGIAHVVNGISITSSYSNAVAFSRVDFTLDAVTGEVIDRRIFPPQPVVPAETYEGVPIRPLPEMLAIAERAGQLVAERQAESTGAILATAMTLEGRPESVLGNLMTDAIREVTGADIAIHNVFGGLRADLPAGELTYGSVFRMFPFDNRVAVIELTGAELRRIIANQAAKPGRHAGFSGMRVFVDCIDGGISIRMERAGGREIADTDVLSVAVNDFLLLGGDDVLTPVIPGGGFDVPYDTPLVRDSLLQWFAEQQGSLHAGDFFDKDNRRWNLPDSSPGSCGD
jgi:5'-nucleotidase